MSGFADSFNTDIDGVLMASLGDDVIYVTQSGSTSSIKGQFEAEYYQTNSGTGVESSSPAVLCNSIDVPNYGQGGKFIYHDLAYKIVSSQPDGTGQVLLILQAYDSAQSTSFIDNVLLDADGSMLIDVDGNIITTV